MEISQLSFILLAAYSFCFGAILGVVYDALRITRILLGAEREKEHSRLGLRHLKLPIINKRAYPEKQSRFAGAILNAYVAVGDILFVSACGMLAVMIAYAYNSGKIRAIIFVGLVAGFLLYYYTVGKLAMKVSELIGFALRSVLVYVFTAVSFAIGKISKMFKIKKKGAKKDAKQNRKSKRSVSS